jgi:fatty-acyl-CoA synthase
MDFNFATAWELISDVRGDAPALTCAGNTRSWREYDDRAARIAGLLDSHGLGLGAKAGLYLHNSNEYVEAQYGIFKTRGCPINVNYRYKDEELIYLLDNADAEALFFQGCYAPMVAEIRAQLPNITLYVQVDDGTEPLLDGAVDFETALNGATPMPRIERAADDLYMLYTGGTTGMPKGVMYNNGEFCYTMATAFVAQALGVEPPTLVEEVPGLVEKLVSAGAIPRSLTACPLMHGTGMWLGTMIPLLAGGSVVTIPTLGLDPDMIWKTVAEESVTDIAIVGDAFAKPLLAGLDKAKADGHPYDLSSLRQIISSGVMWSSDVKNGLLAHHDMMLIDAMGSSEGSMGSSVATREQRPDTAKFEIGEGVKVISDDGREVAPGSGEIGKLATSGFVPIGYYKDPVKSAETFREFEGVRYSFPGDYATIEADGSITLLGRGSACINSAGEKVFPEEVEEAVKRHPDVYDCLVVGVPDERFGERVVAVASLRGDGEPAEDVVIGFTREHLAGYKLPKHILFVPEVKRAPNGKADYKWARQAALDELA